VEPTGLTTRFTQAFLFAFQLHAGQSRKGSRTPYIAHLIGVAALVLEYGGDEDQAIAALLHDAVEDQGGIRTLEEIHRRFGERVAVIVAGCTDAYTVPKPPWRERKERYIQHLAEASPDVWLVSLADKVHNARSVLADLRREGEGVWDRFKGGKTGTLWYYHSLLNAFRRLSDSPLSEELDRVVADIEQIGA
jgi:GTP pyrophosphokinase